MAAYHTSDIHISFDPLWSDPISTKKRPEDPLVYNEEKLPHGNVGYSVTQVMSEPIGSPHVRGVAIYIPRLRELPNLTIRIIGNEGSSPLMVSSLKINEDVGGYMQIAIQAQILPLGASRVVGSHHCNIVAIGHPLAKK